MNKHKNVVFAKVKSAGVHVGLLAAVLSVLSAPAMAGEGCVIKAGKDPSVPVRYNPGQAGGSTCDGGEGNHCTSQPSRPASTSGGGVIGCLPKSVIDNGQRKVEDGKTWLLKPDGQWINLDTYPYDYVSTDAGDGGALDAQQTARLDAHDVDLTDIKNKNKQQDDRLAGHDKAIGSIQDGAVFYNRDQDGKKTGGVTLNDGVSTEGVQVSNVAKAKDGHDAVNLDQLRDSLGGGARTDNNGNYIGPKYNIGGIQYGNVGDALNAQNALAVKYTADANGKPTNNIVLSGDGTGAPVGITNVRAGVNVSDAVNKGQLDGVLSALGGGAKVNSTGGVTAPTYNIGGHGYNNVEGALTATNNRINDMASNNAALFDRLGGRITDVRNDARAGIAGASALAAMRYDDRPGKVSLASGFGGFKDHQAMSAGIGYTTTDGVFRMNAGASYDFQNDGTAWNIGLGWTLN